MRARSARLLFGRTYKEVFDGHRRSKDGNVEVDLHLQSLERALAWLLLTPVMRYRKIPLDVKDLLQVLGHFCDGLNVIVGGPDQPAEVSKVDVGHDELAVVLHDGPDFIELAILLLAHVLEKAHGNHEIEALSGKIDRVIGNVDLLQVRRRIMDGDVDAVVSDIRSQHRTQRR